MAKILMQRLTWRSVTPIVLENWLVVSAISLAAAAYGGRGLGELEGAFLLRAVLVAAVCQFCLYWDDLYAVRGTLPAGDLAIRLLKALGGASLVLATLAVLAPSLVLSPAIFIPAAGMVVAMIVAWRAAFDRLTEWVGPRERLLLVGARPATYGLAEELLSRKRELGVEIAGFVDVDPDRVPSFDGAAQVIGTVEDIPALVARHRIDRVVVSLVDARGKLPMDALLDMRLKGVRFDHLASVYEEYTGKIAIENLRPSWFIFSHGFGHSLLSRAAKRALDIVVAGASLVLAAPVMLAVAIAVRLTSAGPVLYHQTRTGQHGRPFTIHKFRTMRQDAEAGTGPAWAVADDPRVTPVGAFLRRVRLDELPQLWNVLRGNMSLVGPRPERPEFVDQLTADIPFYGQRHVVKPGLTGWAQVRYTYAASVEDTMQKLQYELFYIKNLSLALDVFILFLTLKTVLLARGGR